METKHSKLMLETIKNNKISQAWLSRKTNIGISEINSFIHGKKSMPLYKIEMLMDLIGIELCKK